MIPRYPIRYGRISSLRGTGVLVCRLRQELRDLPASGLSIEEQDARIVEIRDNLQAARTATIEQEAVRKE